MNFGDMGRRARPAAVIAAVLVMMGTGTAASAAPAAPQVVEVPAALATARQDDGLRVESSATYTVDLDASVLHVAYTATLTNTTPSVTTATHIRSYYFDGFSAAIIPGASNLHARQGGRELRTSISDADSTAPVADVHFASNLNYRQTQTITLTYDVATQPARSGSMAQVNQAYAVFPVFVFADPSLGSVTVTLPRDVERDIVGEDLNCKNTSATTATCTAEQIADPDTWYTLISVRDDDAMVERTLNVADKEIHLRAWPGDDEWLDFMSDTVERGLPELNTLFGRSWGDRTRLDIIETSAPYLYGYAGWYEFGDSRIEIGDELDAEVALHEISHSWLNSTAFADRWILEGLAQEYAAAALSGIGGEPHQPESIDQSSPVAVPLAAWGEAAPNDPDTSAREEYGYAASWWVTDQLEQEIGLKSLSEVVRAGADSVYPYPAPTMDEHVLSTPNWHTYLDLLEGIGGSEQATELFREHVASEDDLALLDQRAKARKVYTELLETGDGWVPPSAMRSAMTAWRFDNALGLAPQVSDLFAQRDQMADALATIEHPVPDSLQEQFEAETNVTDLGNLMDDAQDAVTAYVAARSARADADPFTWVGLLLTPSVARNLDSASSAMNEGEWTAASEAARMADDGLGVATRTGAITIAVLVLLIAGAVAVVIRRRRTPTPTPDDEAASDVAEAPESDTHEPEPSAADDPSTAEVHSPESPST